MIKISTTKQIKSLTGSHKKNAYLFLKIPGQPIQTGSFWDSGSRSYYTVKNMITGEEKTPPSGLFPTFAGEYTLQPSEILIEREISQGKAAPPSFTCLASEKGKCMEFLGNPTVEF